MGAVEGGVEDDNKDGSRTNEFEREGGKGAKWGAARARCGKFECVWGVLGVIWWFLILGINSRSSFSQSELQAVFLAGAEAECESPVPRVLL